MWIPGGVVTVVAVVVALVALNAATTHDLLSADFQSGPAPFTAIQKPAFAADVVDGTYRIQTTAPNPGPIFSYALFARTAYSVDISADVKELSAPGDDVVWGGIGVSNGAGDHYYILGVDNVGDVTVGRIEPDKSTHEVASGSDPDVKAGAPFTLKLSIVQRDPLTSAVSLTAFVNGRQVVSGKDSGIDGFARGVVHLITDKQGAVIRVDNVAATVPGK